MLVNRSGLERRNLQTDEQARPRRVSHSAASSKPMPAPVRIFAACHGTQLLVIQHLRRHLELPPAKELLLWHPMENIPFIDSFMKSVIPTANFIDTLDIRDFESLRPRTQGSLTWWLESTRRLRRDAATVRSWLNRNGITEHDMELWTDDPIHFYVNFSRGALRKSRQVKIPHCFNHEDVTMPEWKESLERQWRGASWSKRLFFLPWQRLTSGVDMRMERVVYDRAYTFDRPSPWSSVSVNVSHLISIDAFDATYRTLPAAVRRDVKTILDPIRASRRPLVLLLLFGLGTGPELRRLYEKSVKRVFSERAAELANCSLAVKVHPGFNGREEHIFIDWLRANIPAPVHAIVHPLNLEFMLPQLRPDYVMAGLCGALPIIRALRVGQPIAVAEMVEEYLSIKPEERQTVMKFLQGIEVW
jgi:hypothetical protein